MRKWVGRGSLAGFIQSFVRGAIDGLTQGLELQEGIAVCGHCVLGAQHGAGIQEVLSDYCESMGEWKVSVEAIFKIRNQQQLLGIHQACPAWCGRRSAGSLLCQVVPFSCWVMGGSQVVLSRQAGAGIGSNIYLPVDKEVLEYFNNWCGC